MASHYNEIHFDFPMSFEIFVARTSDALIQVSRCLNPSPMMAQAPNTIREAFEDELQPFDTARCILDDAMTGNRW